MLKRYTTKEAALAISRNEETLTRALRDGSLCGSQAAGRKGRWSIREDCLEAYIDNTDCPTHGKRTRAATTQTERSAA